METPRPESDPVALRLAQAAERLKAQQAPGAEPAPEFTAEDALRRLKTVCAELREADLEVRHARTRIAQLAAEAAARAAPLEAA